MGEGDVGEGGSGRTKYFAITIVLVLAIASIGAYIMLDDEGEEDSSSTHYYVYWDTEYTESAWLINIVDIDKPESLYGIGQGEIEFQLVSKTGGKIDGWTLDKLRNTTSPAGVNWIDLNNNNYVEIGEYIYIDRSNPDCIVNLEEHDLALSGNGVVFFRPSSDVYLPPAEFLDMGVVKTPTGWNMTVTWVNETIPVEFLDAWNVSFRLENKSGEFLTYYQNDPSFWLGFIRHPLPDYNYSDQGFYNITWCDYDENSIISLNDTFIIDNYSGLVGTDYTFRLMSNIYGFGHTLIKVILI